MPENIEQEYPDGKRRQPRWMTEDGKKAVWEVPFGVTLAILAMIITGAVVLWYLSF